MARVRRTAAGAVLSLVFSLAALARPAPAQDVEQDRWAIFLEKELTQSTLSGDELLLLSALAADYAFRLGDTANAARLYTYAIQHSGASNLDSPGLSALIGAALNVANLGDEAVSSAVLPDIVTRVRNAPRDDSARIQIVELAGRLKGKDDAVQWLDQLGTSEKRIAGLRSLARGLGGFGDAVAAREAAEAIPNGAIRDSALYDIVAGAYAAGKVDVAQATLSSLPVVGRRAALGMAIDALVALGQFDRAVEIILDRPDAADLDATYWVSLHLLRRPDTTSVSTLASRVRAPLRVWEAAASFYIQQGDFIAASTAVGSIGPAWNRGRALFNCKRSVG